MSVGGGLWGLEVPMRDGVELALDVMLPPGDGPWPAVVMRTPYMRGNILRAGVWTRLLEYGYALVAGDVRGRGDSAGQFVPQLHDADDGYDTVEWVAAQPWCTGRVGMVGVSYEAITQWWAAKSRPPHLCCIAPMAVGAATMGARMGCDTGVPTQYWIWWFNLVTGRTLQNPCAPSWGANFDHLPLRTLHERVGTARRWWPKYVEGEIGYLGPDHVLSADEWARFDVPALVGVGWWDDQTTIANWLALRDSPASGEARLLIGAWDHHGNEEPRPMLGGLDVSPSVMDPVEYVERFLSAHLKGDADGHDGLPRCRVFRTGAMQWENLDDWPSPDAEATAWYLGARGALGRQLESEVGSDPYTYDPTEPVLDFSELDRWAWSDPPLDCRYLLRRPDVLVFTTEPLDRPVDVSGRAFFDGFVSVDAPDTDIAVSLFDAYPDGRAIYVGAWIAPPPLLRLAFRNGADPEPLDRGEIAHVQIPLCWLHHRFLPDHRIGLAITSSAFPVHARNLNRGEPWADAVDPRTVEVSVHRGAEHPSRLVLPVEPELRP